MALRVVEYLGLRFVKIIMGFRIWSRLRREDDPVVVAAARGRRAIHESPKLGKLLVGSSH